MSGCNCFNNRTIDKFDDPFLMPSNDVIPTSLSNGFDLCRFLYNMHPQFKEATRRVVRHFITDFTFPGKGSAEEKKKLRDYMTYKLKLQLHLMEMGDEWSCYGNALYRIHKPFDRYLIHPEKRTSYHISMFNEADVKFDLKTMTYEVYDPHNKGKKLKLEFTDIPNKDKDKIRLIKLDPRQMVIRECKMSGERDYIYRFDEFLKRDIKSNQLYQINGTPKAMLEAIRDDSDFLFNPGSVFHFRGPVISGLSDYGWGFPLVMENFRSIYQLQVYKKADEIVGLDYLLPLRYFSPEPGAAGATNNTSLGMTREFNAFLQKAIKVRRKDKTAMFAFPFPVKYEEVGVNGKHFAPKDLIEYQTNDMLDGMGYPAELFRASLQIQQVPTAIRMFENCFWFIHTGMVDFINWAMSNIQEYLGEEVFEVGLKLPSMADDIDKQNVLLQLGMQGELPRTHYLGNLGIDDPVASYKERIEEDIEIQKAKVLAEEKFQSEMEAQQAALNVPPAGAAQGGVEEMNPMDIEARAMEEAQRLLSIPSQGERTKAMQALKAQNLNLYTLAKQFMDEMRNQGAAEGRQAVNAQFQG